MSKRNLKDILVIAASFATLFLPAVVLADTNGANDEPEITKCPEPRGTLTVAEPQQHVVIALMQRNLPPPTDLLRLFVQESGCFEVVDRGLAMQNMQQERVLAENGMLQRGSNVGGGQMVSVDFIMTPNVVFSDSNAGGVGVGSAVGSLFGGIGSLVGAVAGGLKFKEAQTSLLLTDARSGLQITAATGSAEKTDWAFGGVIGSVGGGGYTSTAEGKIVAAALLNNFNTIVADIESKPGLLKPQSAIAQDNAKQSLTAINIPVGEVLRAKIGNQKLLSSPDGDPSTILATLDKGEEVVFLGEQSNGLILVQAEAGEGWVKAIMFAP